MYLALAGGLPYFGYAADEDETRAILMALRYDDTQWLKKSDTPINVFEVSDDWEVDGFGTIRATRIQKIITGKIPPAKHMALLGAIRAIEDAVDELRSTPENIKLAEEAEQAKAKADA